MLVRSLSSDLQSFPFLDRHADPSDISDVGSSVGDSQGPQICWCRRLRLVALALAAEHKTLPHRPCSPSVRPSPTTRQFCWSLTSTSISCSEELFYQLGLMQFGEINHIRLDPPPEIEAMLDVALELEEDLPVERRESTKKVRVYSLFIRQSLHGP